MAKSCSFRVERHSAAAQEAVYDTLVDVDSWTEWMPSLVEGAWERHGAPETGVGGVRKTRSRLLGLPMELREEILDGSRPHLHSYNILSPPPALNDYRATVVIEPQAGGSLIVWSGTFNCRVPGIGRPMQAVSHWHIARLATALSQAAASR